MATINYKRILSLGASASFVLACDQLLKAYIGATLVPNQSMRLFGQEWLQLTRLPNPGLIFQSFESLPRGQVEFFIRYLPALMLLGFFPLYRYLRGSPLRKFESLGFAVLYGSGLSNLWDHWHSYFVDDTLKMRLWPGSPVFPFNLADLGLCLGLILIIGTLVSEFKVEPILSVETNSST